MKKFIWISSLVTLLVILLTTSCKKEEPTTVPVLSTLSASNITRTTAVCGGNISSDGGAPVISRGICWGTISNPTINNSKTTDGSGSGSFTSSLAGLTAGTNYYVRAYATNSVGTGYGNEIMFSSSAIITPTLTTVTVSSITINTAVSGGNITSDGGATVIARGICWGTASNPSINNNKTTDGSGIGSFTSSLTGLTAGTNYYVRAYATNNVGTGYGNEETFSTIGIQLPTLTTTNISFINSSFAFSGGSISSDGGGAIIARGVCWATTSNPTISNDTTLDGSGTGNFESVLWGLNPCTTYYVRAYASNSAGTAYGNERNFRTTPGLATVTTAEITNKTSTTATSGGNITSDGCNIISNRGVCWSTSPNPTISNKKTSDGIGMGTFTSNLTGLIAGTTYYVRAFATNSAGTVYGNEKSFSTTSAGLATLTTNTVTAITSSSAVSGGNISNDGGGTIIARGVCWATTSAPTINNSKTSNGTGAGSFTSTLTGLTSGTKYYVRAYATNSSGTSYGNQYDFTTTSLPLPTLTTSLIGSITSETAVSGGNITSDGGSTIIARGVCWATTHNPTTSNNYTIDGSGPGIFTSTLTELTGSTTYYVRAYATNSGGTAYGNELSFTTTVSGFAILTTAPITNITQSSFTSGGNITNDGGNVVNTRGVCFSTSPNPTINDHYMLAGSQTGSFTCTINGLLPAKTYYVRAFATNSIGTSYGNELSFTTIAMLFNPNLTYGTITDNDGNVYKTIQIGAQTWMAENLKTTKYNNGDPIPYQTSASEWFLPYSPKYCYYNNDINNKLTYGALYNWFTVETGKLCPAGWHVPSTGEWYNLVEYLGGLIPAQLKLKETGTWHWPSDNISSTNESGFTALGGGYRTFNGQDFMYLNESGRWWTSTGGGDYSPILAGNVIINFNFEFYTMEDKSAGLSVRCLKNAK